jgi:hypothetical protein
MSEKYSKAMDFLYYVVRAQFIRGVADRELRSRLRQLPLDTSLNQLIYQSRTVLATAVDLDPKDGVQSYLPPRQRPRRNEPPRQERGRQQGQPFFSSNQPGAGQQGRDGSTPYERWTDERWADERLPQQQRVGAQSVQGVRCYECNKFGHFAKDCPRRDGDRGGRQDQAAALMASGVLGYSATINLGDESRKGRLLVDTGAGHSVISPSFVGEKTTIFTGPKITGKSWTGQQLATDKYVDVELVSNEVALPSRFAVMKCPENVDLVLGVDWLSRHSVSINVGTRQIKSLGRLVFGSDDTHDFGNSVIAVLQEQADGNSARGPEVVQSRARPHQVFSNVLQVQEDHDNCHNTELTVADFYSGHHIRKYCAATNIPVPPNTKA